VAGGSSELRTLWSNVSTKWRRRLICRARGGGDVELKDVEGELEGYLDERDRKVVEG